MADPTTPENTTLSSPRKPLLHWFDEASNRAPGNPDPEAPPPLDPDKYGKRDLLCIAVLQEGWDFLQNPGSMTEKVLTREEYVGAIDRAALTYGDCLGRVKRPSACVVLAHPKALLAVVIRRPSPAEAEALARLIRDESVSSEDTMIRLRDDLQRRLLWPAPGSEPMAYMMEDSPLSFTQIFPAMVQEAGGSDAFSKRRG